MFSHILHCLNNETEKFSFKMLLSFTLWIRVELYCVPSTYMELRSFVYLSTKVDVPNTLVLETRNIQ